LDVGLFQPLSISYSIVLNRIIHESLGFTSMRKRDYSGLHSKRLGKRHSQLRILRMPLRNQGYTPWILAKH
jgi:hypothetical protein